MAEIRGNYIESSPKVDECHHETIHSPLEQ